MSTGATSIVMGSPPLFALVRLALWFVWFLWLIWFVWFLLVGLVQPNKRNKQGSRAWEMASSRSEVGIMPHHMVSSPYPPSNEVLRKMSNRFS